MKKTLTNSFRTIVLTVAASAFLAFTLNSSAADKTPASGGDTLKSVATPPNSTRYPITGKVSAVDKAAKTFSIKGAEKDRVFKVNPQTKILRHGKSATLSEVVVGEEVGGYVEKQKDGSVVAITVRFGPKPEEDLKDSVATKKDSIPSKPASEKTK